MKPLALDLLFKPKNIAIIGAKKKLYYIITGFIEHGFDLNNLYLISSTDTELFGLKCLATVDDIPEDSIDLVILAVRRDLLVDSLKELLSKKDVRFIHFFSAGTGEADDIGVQVEHQLNQILLENGRNTRAIGPNCMGVYCPEGKNTYSPTFSKESGRIGLIFHSGDLHSKMIIYGSFRYNLTFSKGVSVGNCIDLQVADFLEYFNKDEMTNFICIYFEGFSKYHEKEGKRLFNVLKAMEKPVLFLRGGQTARARMAVSTHTGSLGTDEKIWQAIYRQTPLIEAGKILDDLLDGASIFNHFFKKHEDLPRARQLELYPKNKEALVIIWSGGLGIIDTDVLTGLGIHLPYFSGEAKERLMNVYPLKIGSLSNPLDLPWIVATEIFVNIGKAAVSDEISLVIIETDSPLHWDEERFERYYKNLVEIKNHVESLDKVLMLVLPEYPHPVRQDYYKKLISEGFLVYPSIYRAGKAFLMLHDYGLKLRIFNKNQ